jgi:hypothetical protein
VHTLGSHVAEVVLMMYPESHEAQSTPLDTQTPLTIPLGQVHVFWTQVCLPRAAGSLRENSESHALQSSPLDSQKVLPEPLATVFIPFGQVHTLGSHVVEVVLRVYPESHEAQSTPLDTQSPVTIPLGQVHMFWMHVCIPRAAGSLRENSESHTLQSSPLDSQKVLPEPLEIVAVPFKQVHIFSTHV